MTLAEFRATGRDVDDLNDHINGMGLEGRPGRVYGDLFIERWADDRFGAAPPGGPTWLLTLYSDQEHGELERLEELLFDFAKTEGWIE